MINLLNNVQDLVFITQVHCAPVLYLCLMEFPEVNPLVVGRWITYKTVDRRGKEELHDSPAFKIWQNTEGKFPVRYAWKGDGMWFEDMVAREVRCGDGKINSLMVMDRTVYQFIKIEENEIQLRVVKSGLVYYLKPAPERKKKNRPKL